ncbi:MAG: hypothetical protein PHU08_06280, partial [Dehalococcoidales bacterium]|nr:hypothetical protein [Dehalococcoidales bacterium]
MTNRAISGLLIVLLLAVVSPMVMPATTVAADIGKLKWDIVATPGLAGNVVVSPSEASAFAVGKDGKTLYLSDLPAVRLLRSTNSGATWDQIQSPAGLGVYQLAVAPDDEKIVAAVVAGRTDLYVSLDSGSTWVNTNTGLLAPEFITAVDISSGYNYNGTIVHDYAVVTRVVPPGAGAVYILQDRPNLPDTWVPQAAPAQSFLSIRFPADYTNGYYYAVIGADGTDSYLNLGTRNVMANTTLWNAAGGHTNYPVKISSVGWGGVVTADLALPSDFCVSTYRVSWLTLDDGTLTGNRVYRVDGSRLYPLGCPQVRPYSLAYYGTTSSGKLLVGGVYGAQTTGGLALWRTFDPRSSLPTWDFADKPPSGGLGIGAREARLVVAWSRDGSQAFASSFTTAVINTVPLWANGLNWQTGFPNDESAFSWSVDDGEIWNQPSYIDTIISGLNDVGPSEDGKVVYLASYKTGAGIDSLWRSVSLPLGKYWERVRYVDAPGDRPILRLVPGEKSGAALFWADYQGATGLIERSLDFG